MRCSSCRWSSSADSCHFFWATSRRHRGGRQYAPSQLPNGDPILNAPSAAAHAPSPAWSRWLEIGRAQKARFELGGVLPHAPRQVLLFSGHMVDAPDRAVPRFPPHQVAAAAEHIGAVLDALEARTGDLALTQGAAGGDLLFAEACLARGSALQLLLPLPEAEFERQSLRASADGAAWSARFAAVKARCAAPPLVLDEAVADPPGGGSAFEQGNLWLLATALAYGIERLRFVCLWDGGGGDGAGGTRHLVDEVRRLGGQVSWIDVRSL
jgi:hypothetical protein